MIVVLYDVWQCQLSLLCGCSISSSLFTHKTLQRSSTLNTFFYLLIVIYVGVYSFRHCGCGFSFIVDCLFVRKWILMQCRPVFCHSQNGFDCILFFFFGSRNLYNRNIALNVLRAEDYWQKQIYVMPMGKDNSSGRKRRWNIVRQYQA